MRHSTRNFRPAFERLEERALLSAAYVQTNLVSNVEGMALITDSELVNPWDVNAPQNTHSDPPYYVADQGSGVATSYQISSDGSTVTESRSPVTIPKVGFSEPSGPTGLVQNKHPKDFLIPGPDGNVPATYIFDTLQGTIEGYSAHNTGDINSAEIVVNNSSTAEYTGLAAGTVNGQDYIYAVNEGTNPGIQVFDSSFHQVILGNFNFNGNPNFKGNFIDPCLPAGFIPYGVRDLSLGTHTVSDLFVTYRGPNFQGGAVAVFTNDGTFLGQIACDTTERGDLQSPWGLAFIKRGFGEFSGDLLVGNFSSGQIDAYTVTVVNPKAGKAGKVSAVLDGKLHNAAGKVLEIPGLRAIHFGPGLGSGQTHVALLFTAEIDIDNGNLSLYGTITPATATSAKWIVSDHTLYVYGDQTATNDTISVETNGIDGGVLVTMNDESVSFRNGKISAIDIYPETGANTVSVLNTNVPVTIYDTSSDSVQIGNGDDGLQGIKGTVEVNGGGSDSLTVDDQANTNAEDYVLTDNSISNHILDIAYSGIANVALKGSSAGSSYSIFSTAANVSYSIQGGGGADAFNVSNFYHTLGSIAGAVNISGGGGADSLTLDGQHDGFSLYGIDANELSGRDAPIYYSSMASVVFNGSSAVGSIYLIDSTAAGTSYIINAGSGTNFFDVAPVIIHGVGGNLDTIAGPVAVNGGGADSLTVTDQNNTANLTYSLSTGAIKRTGAAKITFAGTPSVTLDGGSGNETFQIKSFDPTVQFSIKGGGGVNTLDYAAFSGDVTVDLPLDLATGLTGGISNIQHVTGSKGNDILVGDANPNVLIGGTGRNLIIGGDGDDAIIGGPSGDILIGDYTDYDTNIAALDAVMAEWASGDSYATRYGFITGGGGLNGSSVLNTTTVHNDFANDTMTGGAGRNWFFASSGDTITDAVTSGTNKEYITTI